MKRAYQSSAVMTKPSYETLTSQGYPTNGDPVNSVPPTQPGAAWFSMVTEELVSVIEAAKLTPDNSQQLVSAINKLIESGINGASSKFVTVDGQGVQQINQAKKFLQSITGKKLTQGADLAEDSLSIPVWANIVDYAISKSQAGNFAKLNAAQTFEQAQTFSKQIIASGGLKGDVTGNLTGDVEGDLTGDVTGNADTASKWKTTRTLTLSGDLKGSVPIDGSQNVTLEATLKANNGAVPVGAIIPYMGQGAVPDGYLLCNGAAVSRTTYAKLYAVIGVKFGAGDGSTTFTLPNLNGRFLEGTTGTPGESHEAGLPNISGGMGVKSDGYKQASGPFYGKINDPYSGDVTSAGMYLYFDAKRANNLYGKSTSVQPAAYLCQYFIKY